LAIYDGLEIQNILAKVVLLKDIKEKAFSPTKKNSINTIP